MRIDFAAHWQDSEPGLIDLSAALIEIPKDKPYGLVIAAMAGFINRALGIN